MEDLSLWPASIFDSDPTTLEMERTGLGVTDNTKCITTIKKWGTEAEGIKLDVDTETEGVQMDLMLAREFLNVQTLTESRAKELKTLCENHSKCMSTTGMGSKQHQTQILHENEHSE